MSTTLAPPVPAAVARQWPRVEACDDCDERIIVTAGAWVLDGREVFPEGPCRGAAVPGGHGCRGAACLRCFGTGRVGEPIVPPLVLLDAFGRARPYLESEGRRSGEAFHRRHRC
jgi:hypothetical protein